MPPFERDLQTIKEEIRARSDIVEVVSQYVQLKRTGKTWTGLCPFHSDRRPDFRVYPATQTYKCWACKEHGDVFKFIEKKESLEFIEALEFLARRAGIPFERRGQSPEQVSEREQMFALNALAAQYFKERLGRSREARDYLAGRAILKPTQEQWDLGFAPPEWEGLAYYLQRKRADLALAVRLGLIRVREPSGGHYDTFRNRLMFPIHDVQGRVIAFGGRAMGDDSAKYLNSEQSPLFDKSRTLYGLVFARKALSPSTPAVFVEGYVDVITTHQAGFTQCVATLGTSMTEEHARMLSRLSPRVIICYDADSAGTKATLRGATVWESIGVEGAEVRVARLPAGEDPDSLVRGGQTAAFQRALDDAVPRVDFEIEMALKRHAVDTDQGKADALAEIIPILASVRTLTQRDKYVERVAHLHPSRRFNFPRAIEALLGDVEQYIRQAASRAPQARDRGYPLTEQSNRAPLANEPQPPIYRPPTAGGWGRWDPGTSNIVRPGGAEPQGGRGYTPDGGSRDGRYSRRRPRDPLRDYSPPSLAAPELTRAEKAERQLLRALFTADWRSYVLGRVNPELFITPAAREMFGIAARMPARDDGTIDPALVMRQAEELEAERAAAASDGADSGRDGGDSPATAPEFAETLEMDGPEETASSSLNGRSTEPPDRDLGDSSPMAMSGHVPNYRHRVINPARTSDFIREVLEDSLSVMSNEPLSDVALLDCIRKLNLHREEQKRSELTDLLGRKDLPPEQLRAYKQQYQEMMRKSRGSPPAVEDDNS